MTSAAQLSSRSVDVDQAYRNDERLNHQSWHPSINPPHDVRTHDSWWATNVQKNALAFHNLHIYTSGKSIGGTQFHNGRTSITHLTAEKSIVFKWCGSRCVWYKIDSNTKEKTENINKNRSRRVRKHRKLPRGISGKSAIKIEEGRSDFRTPSLFAFWSFFIKVVIEKRLVCKEP